MFYFLSIRSIEYLNGLNEKQAKPLIEALIRELNNNAHYFEVLTNSKLAKTLIDKHSELKGGVISQFITQIKHLVSINPHRPQCLTISGCCICQ